MQRLHLVLLLAVPCVFAQDRAAINGTVVDPSGSFVPGATIEAKSTATGLHRTASTNQEGLYNITPLPVGEYTLTITKDGFKPTTVSNIDLQYGGPSCSTKRGRPFETARSRW